VVADTLLLVQVHYCKSITSVYYINLAISRC